MQQHFFQSFFGQPQEQVVQERPEYIIYNELLLEISNNWQYVINVIKRYRAGTLQKVDQLEHTWLNFLLSNSIDIEQYNDEQEFLKTFWKTV